MITKTISTLSLISVIFLSSFAFAAIPSVTSVSGKCEADIEAQAEKHLGPSTDDFDFQGFGDLSSIDANEFDLTYSFNDECVSGVSVKISPLKVIQKLNGLKKPYLEATECAVEKITDYAAECG
jgi:hypothetical protein